MGAREDVDSALSSLTVTESGCEGNAGCVCLRHLVLWSTLIDCGRGMRGLYDAQGMATISNQGR